MIGCVLMAAGIGSRFGANKLLAEFQGRPLYLRAMDAVPPELRTVVVTGSGLIAEEARRRGFAALINDRPEDGASRSVALGTAALLDCEAILYLVGDQPLLTMGSLRRLVSRFRQSPGCICAAASGGKRGNPCLFPRDFYDELRALHGDCGGSAVIRRHEDRLRLLELPPLELADVDTPGALLTLQEELWKQN